MTTPNEDLILKLRGQAYTTCRPDQLCDQAADLLQSQADRIKELEKQHIERLLRIEKEVDVLFAERDELREKYTDTYWALDDAARENTSLRAQLTAIAATEPVAWMHTMDNTEGCPENEPWSVLMFDSDNPFGIPGEDYSESYPITAEPLFTRPMPAQDVTELVEALEKLASLGNGDQYGNSDGNMIARDALAKFKGAK